MMPVFTSKKAPSLTADAFLICKEAPPRGVVLLYGCYSGISLLFHGLFDGDGDSDGRAKSIDEQLSKK